MDSSLCVSCINTATKRLWEVLLSCGMPYDLCKYEWASSLGKLNRFSASSLQITNMYEHPSHEIYISEQFLASPPHCIDPINVKTAIMKLCAKLIA